LLSHPSKASPPSLTKAARHSVAFCSHGQEHELSKPYMQSTTQDCWFEPESIMCKTALMSIIPNIILNPKFSSFQKTTDVEHTKGK